MFQIKDLDLNEVNVIMAGLGELPAKISTQLIMKVSQQIDVQRKEYESKAGPSDPQIEIPNFKQ